MNVFTTEHPIANTPKMNPWGRYFWQSLAVALPLFVILGTTWWWLAVTTNEDVPDPSWTDYLGDAAAIVMVFPAGLLFWAGEDNLPVTLVCLFLDCLFWAGVFVLLCRMLRWYFGGRAAVTKI